MSIIFNSAICVAIANLVFFLLFQIKFQIWASENFRYRIGRALLGSVFLFFLALAGQSVREACSDRIYKEFSWVGVVFLISLGCVLIAGGGKEYKSDTYAKKYLGLTQILVGTLVLSCLIPALIR